MVAVRQEHWQVQRAGCRRAAHNLLSHRRWTTPQLEYLSELARNVVWRAGNQVGKSEALAADIVWTARGDHPFREVRPNGPGPVEIFVVSYSMSQMRPLMWKIWQLLDKREIDPKLSCTKGGGLKGYKEPHITFIAGPGKGSVIYFGTYKQGTEALAGPTLDAVFCDEPMSDLVYGELAPRLIRRNGTMRITMTPTPDSAPQLWLKEKIEADHLEAAQTGRLRRWRDLQTTISEENLTPRGALVEVPFKTQEQIDEIVADYLGPEIPMRVHGAWEAVQADRVLLNYGPDCIIGYTPDAVLTWVVGIDHGVKAGRQAAVLVGYDTDSQTAYLLDEYRADGRSSTREDARAITSMLRDNGVDWRDVSYWIGDRRHSGDHRGAGKSNRELRLALCREWGVEPTTAYRKHGLWINTPTKGTGSSERGMRLMNSLMRTGEMLVHARCESFDDAARNWGGAKQDPRKDILDAANYAISKLVDANVLYRREASDTMQRIH